MVPIVVVDEEHKGVPVPEDDDDDDEDDPKNRPDSSTTYGWYLDCPERQVLEHRYHKDYHSWEHTDHVKRMQPIADVTADMKTQIREDAEHNVSIGSIVTSQQPARLSHHSSVLATGHSSPGHRPQLSHSVLATGHNNPWTPNSSR